MGERPIIFSGPMIRALLAGRKTQTRRIIKPRGKAPSLFDGQWSDSYVLDPGNASWRERDVPVKPRDRLWVRETYFQRGHWAPVQGAIARKGNRQKWAFVPADNVLLFEAPASYRKGRHAADPATIAWHKRIGRFMPRQYSRLTLVVTDVRVQRLQEISEEDAVAEGVAADYLEHIHGPRGYRDIWETINGPGSLEANPWIVAYTFTVNAHNIDALAKEDAA